MEEKSWYPVLHCRCLIDPHASTALEDSMATFFLQKAQVNTPQLLKAKEAQKHGVHLEGREKGPWKSHWSLTHPRPMYHKGSTCSPEARGLRFASLEMWGSGYNWHMAHHLLRERTLPMIAFRVTRPCRDQVEACMAVAVAEAEAVAEVVALAVAMAVAMTTVMTMAGARVWAALMESTMQVLYFRALCIRDLQPYHNNQALCYS